MIHPRFGKIFLNCYWLKVSLTYQSDNFHPPISISHLQLSDRSSIHFLLNSSSFCHWYISDERESYQKYSTTLLKALQHRMWSKENVFLLNTFLLMSHSSYYLFCCINYNSQIGNLSFAVFSSFFPGFLLMRFSIINCKAVWLKGKPALLTSFACLFCKYKNQLIKIISAHLFDMTYFCSW